jgi:twitching motility protein PilT
MENIPTAELDQLLTNMLQSAEGISDLLFIAGKPPQIEVHGHLKSFATEPALTSARIESLARMMIRSNARLQTDLAETGSCDCSYSLAEVGRFRVNIYRQNGNYAMVLRRLQSKIPTMEALKLAPVFHDIIKEKTGLIFVTGATGSGKTTTLAAMLNEINLTQEVHIVTLEDPVEFLHPHLQSVFSQRELGRDFYTFPQGLRAALRQAPKVIFVGEIRDRDTMEIALTAGETGHVVYSTLHTISASQTINRILGMFSKDEEQQVRERLAGSLRYVVSQRLAPKIGGGRVLITELMGSNLRSREVISQGETENRRLADIIEAGSTLGWHSFEQSLLHAFDQDLITDETALLYCTNKSAMHLRLDALKKRKAAGMPEQTLKMRMDFHAAPPTVKPPTLPVPPKPPTT